MTSDLNKYYRVSVFPNTKKKIGSRWFCAKAIIYRRDNDDIIEVFYPEGAVISSIYIRATEQAKMKVAMLDIPENWKD